VNFLYIKLPVLVNTVITYVQLFFFVLSKMFSYAVQFDPTQSTVAVVLRYSGQGRCIMMLANQTSRDRHTHTCIYNTVLLATKNTLRLGCIIIINIIILYIIYFAYYYHYYQLPAYNIYTS